MASNKISITVPQMPQVEVKIYGEWQKVTNLINGMPDAVLTGYRIGSNKSAKAIIRIVKRAVKTGLPPKGATWPALAKSTISAHGEHKIYSLKGHYGKAIGIREYKGRIVMGVPINMKVPGAKGSITMNQLGIILEHGTKLSGEGDGRNDIPPRPLWAPSFQEFGGKEKLKKVILREIRSSIISKFNLTANQIREAK